MTVSFSEVPSDIRVPLVYIEIDQSQAGTSADRKPSLLHGQVLPSGTMAVATPTRIRSGSHAAGLGGFGSHFHRAAEFYFKGDSFGELWGIGVADSGTAVHATFDTVIAGPATADGTLYLYIGGQLVNDGPGSTGIAVSDTDAATAIGAAIEAALGINEAAAVTLASPYPVTASNAAGTVTLLARNGGTLGNQIDVRYNMRGPEGGEEFPAGVTGTEPAAGLHKLLSGANDPVLTAAITAMGDDEYDYIIFPFSDATSLTAIAAEMESRWGPLRQIYGMCVSSYDTAYASLAAFSTSNTQNDPHMSIPSIDQCPSTPWERAGVITGRAAGSLRIDPARPLQTLVEDGIVPPVKNMRLTIAERDLLLFDGLATDKVVNEQLQIERLITTYLTDDFGSPDTSFLDVQTLATLQFILRDTKGRIQRKYGRHKLADDGTSFDDGQAIVTPSTIKGELIAAYREYEAQGLVENIDEFLENLIVERNATDVNRIDVLYPPNTVNQFRVLALLAQFRL